MKEGKDLAKEIKRFRGSFPGFHKDDTYITGFRNFPEKPNETIAVRISINSLHQNRNFLN